MKERFFFDWIDVLGYDSAINKADNRIALSSPYAAESFLTITQSTAMCTNHTLHSAVLLGRAHKTGRKRDIILDFISHNFKVNTYLSNSKENDKQVYYFTQCH
jgi:hypothetical protein